MFARLMREAPGTVNGAHYISLTDLFGARLVAIPAFPDRRRIGTAMAAAQKKTGGAERPRFLK